MDSTSWSHFLYFPYFQIVFLHFVKVLYLAGDTPNPLKMLAGTMLRSAKSSRARGRSNPSEWMAQYTRSTSSQTVLQSNSKHCNQVSIRDDAIHLIYLFAKCLHCSVLCHMTKSKMQYIRVSVSGTIIIHSIYRPKWTQWQMTKISSLFYRHMPTIGTWKQSAHHPK